MPPVDQQHEKWSFQKYNKHGYLQDIGELDSDKK